MVMITEPVSDVPVRGRPPRSRTRRAVGAVVGFLLGGLSTMEVIALALVVPAIMALLWATSTVAPERLISDAGFRAAWILLVLAVARPLTWTPYLAPFLAFRKLLDLLVGGRSEMARNAMAHLVTLVVLAGVVWLVVASVAGAGTAILSALAFATGSGSFETLGSFRGDWPPERIALLVAAVILLRPFLPPLGRDLDLSSEPVLGFPGGLRGTVDRYLLVIAVIASAALGLTAYLVGRS